MGTRPAVLIKEIETKKLGEEERSVRQVGTKCRAEHIKHMGVFVLRFANRHYAKVDAVKALDYIQYTDGKHLG